MPDSRTTIQDIYDWINAGGLPASTPVYLDGDGTLCADVSGSVAMTYLHIGFSEPDLMDETDCIDGIPGGVGELVFWGDKKPRWIVEWQPDNGRVFVVVDADGNVGTARAGEMTRDFRKAGGK